MTAHISLLALICYAVVSFITAIPSGVAGGGAGFINAPLLILFGLSPAQAVTTGKLPGLSVAISSLTGLRGVKGHHPKRHLAIVISLALLAGLLAPIAIKNLDSTLYRRILGVVMLATIPVLLTKKLGRTNTKQSSKRQVIGYVLLLPALLMQGIFGAGMGTLVNIVFMAFMGMTALESSIVKRYSQLVLNIVIIAAVLTSHLIVWPAAGVGIVTSAFGAHIGTRLAIRHGNTLVAGVLTALALTSAIYLLVS